MDNQRPQVPVDIYYLEQIMREVEYGRTELRVLRAEAKITHGFLGLVSELTKKNYGEALSEDPIRSIKKAIQDYEEKREHDQKAKS